MKIKIILEGYFQCSPEDFSKEMKVVEIENGELARLIEKGWKIIGSDSKRDGDY